MPIKKLFALTMLVPLSLSLGGCAVKGEVYGECKWSNTEKECKAGGKIQIPVMADDVNNFYAADPNEFSLSFQGSTIATPSSAVAVLYLKRSDGSVAASKAFKLYKAFDGSMKFVQPSAIKLWSEAYAQEIDTVAFETTFKTTWSGNTNTFSLQANYGGETYASSSNTWYNGELQ